MRLIFLFISIILTLSLHSFAQNWAPRGATWHYTTMGSNYITYTKIESIGDTVIQGKSCKTLNKVLEGGCYGRKNNEYMYNENSKVYFWDNVLEEFQVLYDFSKTEGESWIIKVDYHNGIDTIEVRVDSMVSIYINRTKLKKQFVSYIPKSDFIQRTWESTIIENIGDTEYMFNFWTNYHDLCNGPMHTGLRCYEDENLGLFDTGIAPSCNYEYPKNKPLVFTNSPPKYAEYNVPYTYHPVVVDKDSLNLWVYIVDVIKKPDWLIKTGENLNIQLSGIPEKPESEDFFELALYATDLRDTVFTTDTVYYSGWVQTSIHNGGGINQDMNKIVVFQDHIQVVNTNYENEYMVKLFSTHGQLLKKQKIRGNSIKSIISTNDLKHGLYIISIQTNKQTNMQL